MSKIADLLPQEMIAAIAAMVNGSEGTVTTAAKPQVDNRPIVKSSGFYLIRLLNSKSYDSEAVVFDAEKNSVLFEDNSQVTFGDLATVEDVRPDGSAGRHYPVVWGLTQSQGSGAISYLESMSDKPKQASAGSFKKGSGKAGTSGETATIEALLRRLIAEVSPEAQPAKPVPVAGHTKVVAQPAKPVVEPVYVDLTPGQIVRIDGELRQVAADGKRLNKTIV